MRLKSFHAKTMKDAMTMVRQSLGENAVIISTAEEPGGVRVTAAIEEDLREMEALATDTYHDDSMLRDDADGFAAAGDWMHEDGNDEESRLNDEITEIMLAHGVPADVMDHIISCATVLGISDPKAALTAALEHLFAYRPIPQKAYNKAIMMVGAPGAGKTLVTAKLAARAVMNNLKVAVITTDAVRAGGVEQLAAFTKILKVKLHTAQTREELKEALGKCMDADQILIDTAGLNPFDSSDVKELAGLMTAGAIEPMLVLPAGGDASESGDVARVFATLGVRWMMPARIDIARRFGGLLEAAHQGGLAFADASHTPKVAEGLTVLTPERLAGLFLKRKRS